MKNPLRYIIIKCLKNTNEEKYDKHTQRKKIHYVEKNKTKDGIGLLFQTI